MFGNKAQMQNMLKNAGRYAKDTGRIKTADS